MGNDALLERFHIQDLYSKYCYALDSNDAETFLTCFTDDAVFSVSGLRDFVGHEEIQQMVVDSSKGRARHHYLNLIYREQDEHSARCEAYFLLWSQDGENRAYGQYDDTLVKVDGRWLWSRRNINFLWKAPTYTYGRETS